MKTVALRPCPELFDLAAPRPAAAAGLPIAVSAAHVGSRLCMEGIHLLIVFLGMSSGKERAKSGDLINEMILICQSSVGFAGFYVELIMYHFNC